MQRTVTINNKTYTIPEVTFDAICTLEENGVYLLSMSDKERNLATLIRGLVAWIMDVEPSVASREITAHIQNGGNIADILDATTTAIGEAGFFRQMSGNEETGSAENVQEFPQNREQRRHPNKQNQTRNTRPTPRS